MEPQTEIIDKRNQILCTASSHIFKCQEKMYSSVSLYSLATRQIIIENGIVIIYFLVVYNALKE